MKILLSFFLTQVFKLYFVSIRRTQNVPNKMINVKNFIIFILDFSLQKRNARCEGKHRKEATAYVHWKRVGLGRISGSDGLSGRISGYPARKSRMSGTIRQVMPDNPAGYPAFRKKNRSGPTLLFFESFNSPYVHVQAKTD